MRQPLKAYARAHRLPSFLLTTAACGAVALAIARVPLPETDNGMRQVTRAVGFFLAPLLPVPVLSRSLRGAEPYERQAGRSLAALRFLLVVVASAAIIAALLPSALTRPVPDAVAVLLENTTAVVGLTLLLGCWLDERWAWVPVFAVTLIGVNGPADGRWAALAFVDRTASRGDLYAGVAWLTCGVLAYAVHGPPRRD